jgi:hypothetical protein
MAVAVWDTYVKRKDGSVLHFDIITNETTKDEAIIHRYGKVYLQSKGEEASIISSAECQFCHIEHPTTEMESAIQEKGFYILEMDDIPAKLPANPKRRDLILHLRGHFANYRFEQLNIMPDEKLIELINA